MSASPLGRYDTAAASDSLTVTVHLLRLPLALVLAAREQHDELMREFRLMALSRGVAERGAPRRLLELTDLLGRTYAGASTRPDAAVDAALEQGLQTVDLTYVVPTTVAADAAQLAAIMREADEYCRQEKLLTLARPPLLVRFAEWYLAQFIDQTAGKGPVPWDGPLSLD